MSADFDSLLRQFDDPAALTAICQIAVSDASDEKRRRAILFLRDHPSDEGIQALATILRYDDNGVFRRQALMMLGNLYLKWGMPHDAAHGALRSLHDEPSGEAMIWYALGILHVAADPSTIEGLADYARQAGLAGGIEDETEHGEIIPFNFAEVALEALEHIGTPEAIAAADAVRQDRR